MLRASTRSASRCRGREAADAAESSTPTATPYANSTATSSTTATCRICSCGCTATLALSARRGSYGAVGAALRGTHDFRCFETEWPNRASSVRTITHLAVNRFGEWIWLDVEADGFLYNMVRAIAGTLINVGRGYWPEASVAEILNARIAHRQDRQHRARAVFDVREL